MYVYRATVALLLGLMLLLGCGPGDASGTGSQLQEPTPAVARAPSPTSEPRTTSTVAATFTPDALPTPVAITSPAPTTLDIPILLQEVEGSCRAFEEHGMTVGVRDQEGRAQPETVGWTESEIRLGTNYSFSEVETGEPGQVCVETGDLEVKFELELRITRLEWVPPEPPSGGCLEEIERWEQGVIEHEMEHAAHARQIVEEAERQSTSRTYRACAPTFEAARERLEEQVSQAISEELEAVSSRIDRRSEEFHASEEGAPIRSIDCGVCP